MTRVIKCGFEGAFGQRRRRKWNMELYTFWCVSNVVTSHKLKTGGARQRTQGDDYFSAQRCGQAAALDAGYSLNIAFVRSS
jgi:hypothetical protein